MTDLGIARFGSGETQKDVASYAYALNNANQVQVVGYSSFGAAEHATLWQNGKAIDLNSLLPKNSSGWLIERAYGINDSGWIVGDTTTRAYLLTPVG
jgi:probable HAF family extracellular repeat protein